MIAYFCIYSNALKSENIQMQSFAIKKVYIYVNIALLKFQSVSQIVNKILCEMLPERQERIVTYRLCAEVYAINFV